MKQSKDTLRTIYLDFEENVAAYKTDAAGKKGCAFCCTHPGSIHITTVRGLIVPNTTVSILSK